MPTKTHKQTNSKHLETSVEAQLDQLNSKFSSSDGYYRKATFNGYIVYGFKRKGIVGTPQYALVKDDKVRLAAFDEAMEINYYFSNGCPDSIKFVKTCGGMKINR